MLLCVDKRSCLQAACKGPRAHHFIANAALLVQPVLVLENEEAVAEIMQLKTMPIAGMDTVWLLSVWHQFWLVVHSCPAFRTVMLASLAGIARARLLHLQLSDELCICACMLGALQSACLLYIGVMCLCVPPLVTSPAVPKYFPILMGPTSGVEADAVLRDMGRVLEYSNSKQAAFGSQAAATENGMDARCIALTAKRLLSFACQVGWSAVSELLLPIASAMEATASGLVAELENLADGGLTLLHQAVRSRNVDLVSSLASSGITGGHCLQCAALLVTAVHLHASWQKGWMCYAVPSGGLLTCMLTTNRL